jgi:hypothetical protein
MPAWIARPSCPCGRHLAPDPIRIASMAGCRHRRTVRGHSSHIQSRPSRDGRLGRHGTAACLGIYIRRRKGEPTRTRVSQLPPASSPSLRLVSHGPRRDGLIGHLRGSFPGPQVRRWTPREPPLQQGRIRQVRQQRRKDQVHAGNNLLLAGELAS